MKNLPRDKEGLATPPVELLLSYLVYLVGAARVVADDVEEVSGRRNFLTVGGFTRALHKPNGDPAPLARSSQMSKGRDLFCTSLFAQVGQEVSFIAGSSYHHDCLSATDSI